LGGHIQVSWARYNSLLLDSPLLFVHHVLELQKEIGRQANREENTEQPPWQRLEGFVALVVEGDRLPKDILLSERGGKPRSNVRSES